MGSETVILDGIPLSNIDSSRTVDRIICWAQQGSGRVVCTPNVDYIVKARRNPEFRTAILSADLRVPDGMGVVYGSRIAGRAIRTSVTGRLLPEQVLHHPTGRNLRVALFGGPPGAAVRAADRLREAGANIVEAFGPTMDFRIGSPEDETATARLKQSRAQIVWVGLGAPKQELWMAQSRKYLSQTVLIGVGQALDVLSGRVRTAPIWMTRLGVEWAFRLAMRPRTFARRYLWDDPRFFWWMVIARVVRRRDNEA